MRGVGAVLGVVRRFAAGWPWRLVAGVGLLAAATGAGVGLLAASGQLIAGAGLAGAGLVAFDVFGPSARIRFFAVGRTIGRYAERMASHDATLRFLTGLRVRAFRGLAATAGAGARPGVMFNRLTGDLDALDGVPIRFAIPLASGAVVLAGAALALAALDPWLAAAVVLPLVLCGIAAPLAAGSRAAAATRAKLFALDAARVRIADVDRGRASLAAAGELDARVRQVADAFDRAAVADRRLAAVDAVLRAAGGAGSQAAIVGAVLAGAGLAADGTLSRPGFAAVLLATLALSEAVAPLRNVALDFGRWAVAGRRLAPLLDAADAEAVPPAAPPAGRAGARIRAQGLEVTTPGAAAPRLAAVDLVVAPGEAVALVGPSGAGKSTLVLAIAGRIRPTAGRVAVEAEGPGPATVGWLGQRTELFRGTVRDNLRLAAPDADDDRLAGVIAAVRLADALGPDGLDRRLGDEGSGLSGGERRRLALARLMLQDPAVVLLDEPTEGLDEETAAAVFAALRRWAEGRTLVYATHRPAEAAAADRVLAVAGGRVRPA